MKERSTEELRKEAARLRDELWKREYATRAGLNRPMVGKCFVYENSYGVSDGCRKWPLYAYVSGLDDMGYPKGWCFQRTTRDHVEIELNRTFSTLLDGAKPLPRRQFEAAYKRILKTLGEVVGQQYTCLTDHRRGKS